ncbi:MAG TPA: serine/threonine-protein kinase [Myxococcaceae bacterium]|nr:serine/threonine-protein kinase [Myxococcaceae bacterium]
MGTKRDLKEVDPFSLPVGLQVGQWRVKGWRGRGAYGTLYCVERVGREGEGEFALKLAIHSGDERFGREAELLRRIDSPHVPRFREQGVWEHPAGAFRYVVMELVEGEPLYDWAARRNPTSRQVLRLLAQVARALEATHAAGGVHRDVKGANVLVRAGDGRAFLMDFGAGHYRGADTLTSKVLPPGSPAYRSPEAWAFLRAFLRHPTAHYRASACDDLFALGVLAYRLVTDEYPPPIQPGESGAEVWREGGPGARPPRELNPRVSPALEAVILRLLAIAPVERFRGQAREAVEALEKAAQAAGAEGEVPLFGWCDERGLRLRSPEEARLSEERDAAERVQQALREVELRTRADVGRTAWRAAVAVGVLGGLLTVAVRLGGQEEAESSSDSKAREGGRVAVGDSTSTTPSESNSPLSGDKRRGVALPLPEQPLPGQNKPPCKRTGEVEIRGGCWHALLDAKPPCKEEGKEDAYLWKGACYGPSYPTGREPTSSPP